MSLLEKLVSVTEHVEGMSGIHDAVVKLEDADEVTLSQSGNDLVVGIAGTTDSVRAQSFFSGGDPGNAFNQLQQLMFADGTTWGTAVIASKAREPKPSAGHAAVSAQLTGLVSAMAAFGAPSSATLGADNVASKPANRFPELSASVY